MWSCMCFQISVNIVIAVHSIFLVLITTKVHGTHGYLIQQEALAHKSTTKLRFYYRRIYFSRSMDS
jgi:hypothetical protein